MVIFASYIRPDKGDPHLIVVYFRLDVQFFVPREHFEKCDGDLGGS